MKFEKTLIPVFAGVDKIKQMIEAVGVDETFYISAVRPGIKCLIVNGSICDENGTPFQNEMIQERFKWFSSRLQKSNFIGIGKIVLNEKSNHRNANNHGLYPILGYKRPWNINAYDDIFIEIEDIHQPISEYKIKFDTRYKVMEGMHRSTFPDKPVVFMQQQFKGNKNSIAEIIDFAFDAAKEGKTILFKDGNSPYIEGRQSELKNFEADLFEVIYGVISSVKTSEVNVNTQNKICKLLDFIRVKHNDKEYSISMLNASPEHSYYINKMIESGNIKIGETPYAFKAIKAVSELKLVSKL